MDVTGRRNIQSLNYFEGDDENQGRELSNIISGVNPHHGKLLLQPSKINQSQQQLFRGQKFITGTVDIYGGFPGLPTSEDGQKEDE